MTMFRNMEVLLLLGFGLVVTAALLASPAPRGEPMRAEANEPVQMPVVVITGKKLSSTEKTQAAQEAG